MTGNRTLLRVRTDHCMLGAGSCRPCSLARDGDDVAVGAEGVEDGCTDGRDRGKAWSWMAEEYMNVVLGVCVLF
jgi:hypothetical protein